MRKDIYKEAEALIDNILYVNGNTIAGAEATCDADLMAYARAAEYYMRVIAHSISLCRHHSSEMDIKIAAAGDKTCQEIKVLSDIYAVGDADRALAEQHNKAINDAKKNIRHMLTLCSRDGSPLRDLTDDMRQLDSYVNRMHKDLAEQRERLKELRTERITKE